MGSKDEKPTSLHSATSDDAQDDERGQEKSDAIALLGLQAAFKRLRRLIVIARVLRRQLPSNPVDQDIKRALQCIAMLGQRPDWFSQLRPRNGGKLLNADDPGRPVDLDRGRQAGKYRVSARIAQRCHNARRLDAGQVCLQTHDKVPAFQTIEIELCHCVPASETSVRRERQAFFGNLFGIGIDRGFVLHAPNAIAFNLGRLGKTRHVEVKRARRFGNLGIQSQIGLHASHRKLLEHTYD